MSNPDRLSDRSPKRKSVMLNRFISPGQETSQLRSRFGGVFIDNTAPTPRTFPEQLSSRWAGIVSTQPVDGQSSTRSDERLKPDKDTPGSYSARYEYLQRSPEETIGERATGKKFNKKRR
jgi:hypothetical protein